MQGLIIAFLIAFFLVSILLVFLSSNGKSSLKFKKFLYSEKIYKLDLINRQVDILDKTIYQLSDYVEVVCEPYSYIFYKHKNDSKYLLEVTCGMHALWMIWISFNEEEKVKYSERGIDFIKQIAQEYTYNCYDVTYRKRYVVVEK